MIDAVLYCVFGLTLTAGVVIGSAHFWTWYYSGPTSQGETVYLITRDGWRLAVHHYRSRGPSVGLPVILCHGLSSNRYVFDLPGIVSLAQWMSDHGRDVWVPELRGSGISDRPGMARSDVPYSWEFDDHLRQDVPAVIDCVLQRTGAPLVHWVGHSMGGMLALAHVAAAGSHAMASVTALGSPTDFSKVRSGLVDALMAARPLLRLTPIMPLPFLGRLVLPFINGTSLGFFHSANTDPNTSRMTVALASEIVTSSELWLNFGRFVETQSFGRKTGEPYLENLPASEVPIMVIAGAQDLMAPSDSVVSLCEGAPHAGERISVILGRASGCVEDYGHVDLLVGDRVEEEVFPRILQWIEDHDTNAASGESGRTEGPP